MLKDLSCIIVLFAIVLKGSSYFYLQESINVLLDIALLHFHIFIYYLLHTVGLLDTVCSIEL